MGYSHTMTVTAMVKPGTAPSQIAEAFRPILDYFGHDDDVFEGGETIIQVGDDEFSFNPTTGHLSVSVYGDVSYGHSDLVDQVADNLGPLAAEPGEIELYNHDTGDIDNAKSTFVFGPNAETINLYVAKQKMESGLALISEVVGKSGSEDMILALRHFVAAKTRYFAECDARDQAILPQDTDENAPAKTILRPDRD